MKNFLIRHIDLLKESKVYKLISNHPYIFLFVSVIAFELIFSDYNLFVLGKSYFRVNKLETEQEKYVQTIHDDSLKLSNLKTNNVNLIRFAREQYGMKADNEDIFIIRYK